MQIFSNTFSVCKSIKYSETNSIKSFILQRKYRKQKIYKFYLTFCFQQIQISSFMIILTLSLSVHSWKYSQQEFHFLWQALSQWQNLQLHSWEQLDNLTPRKTARQDGLKWERNLMNKFVSHENKFLCKILVCKYDIKTHLLMMPTHLRRRNKSPGNAKLLSWKPYSREPSRVWTLLGHKGWQTVSQERGTQKVEVWGLQPFW